MATVEFDLWVARDKVDNKLYAFDTKPFENEEDGRYYEITGKVEETFAYIFQYAELTEHEKKLNLTDVKEPRKFRVKVTFE